MNKGEVGEGGGSSNYLQDDALTQPNDPKKKRIKRRWVEHFASTGIHMQVKVLEKKRERSVLLGRYQWVLLLLIYLHILMSVCT